MDTFSGQRFESRGVLIIFIFNFFKQDFATIFFEKFRLNETQIIQKNLNKKNGLLNTIKIAK